VPEALRPRLIADVLDEAARGEIDLTGLWAAHRRGRVVGALLTQGLAGRAAAVWAPEVALTWGRAATAVGLIRVALNDLAARGYRVAQALLDESAPRQAAADLARGGLPRVTELAYLERDTTPLALDASRPRFLWRGYDEAPGDEFRAVLQATYEGSLDMPELEGLRSLDDIILGHRAAGRFDPSRWRLGHLEGEPEAAAILLLTAAPGREAWEVAYLGLTPAARGRHLGRSALAHALDLARPHVGRLELAVDARNVPAIRLYRSAGFLPFDRRAVHLVALGPVS
jgi:ribosomal protein S18 acetylase RimI-like enzyme